MNLDEQQIDQSEFALKFLPRSGEKNYLYPINDATITNIERVHYKHKNCGLKCSLTSITNQKDH